MWQNTTVDALGTKPVGFNWHPQEITLQKTVYFVPYTHRLRVLILSDLDL